MRGYLYDLRTSRGYTMREMGEKLGISEVYYSLIEKGERQKQMDITLAVKLSEALSVPLATIVDAEKEAIT